MNNTKTLSIVKKVYYTYIGVCTISGFYYGCKSSINNLKSNYTIIDKFEKVTDGIFFYTYYGLTFGLFSPIFIPSTAITIYNEISKVV
jgi:hypothetical protein